MSRALVSNIQRFSLDDGPGIRTTVFLKGCTLACAWCHNPECLSAEPAVQFAAQQCTLCGQCAAHCPQGAHTITEGLHLFQREKCRACGLCASTCRKGALKIAGRLYEPQELLAEVLKDKHHCISSGGGVTFSGGEPAMYPDVVAACAQLCKEAGLHVALDTAGHVPFSNYETLLPYVDLFLYDVKCFTPELHKQWTGADNARILENLWRLDERGAAYVIRVPVVPGCNADAEEQGRIASFLASLRHVGLIELLPYHNYGVGKYATLGLHSRLEQHQPPTAESMALLVHEYTNRGLNAQIP